MPIFSTGPIENSIVPETGTRPTQTVTIKIDNSHSTDSYILYLTGYYVGTVRSLYVEELFVVYANQVITKTYFADLDAFEFVFSTSGAGASSAQISV